MSELAASAPWLYPKWVCIVEAGGKKRRHRWRVRDRSAPQLEMCTRCGTWRNLKPYTRGGPLSGAEVLDEIAKPDGYVWRSIDGHYFTLDRLEDDHLLNIERFLLGRADLKPGAALRADHDRWTRRYDRIRNEIDKRGLALHADDAAQIAEDAEAFIHNAGR